MISRRFCFFRFLFSTGKCRTRTLFTKWLSFIAREPEGFFVKKNKKKAADRIISLIEERQRRIERDKMGGKERVVGGGL